MVHAPGSRDSTDIVRDSFTFPFFLAESSLSLESACLSRWHERLTAWWGQGELPWLASIFWIQTSHLWEHSEWHTDFVKENVLSRNCKGQPPLTFFHLEMPSTRLCRECEESDSLYIKRVDSECALLTRKAGSWKQKHLYCEWCCSLMPKPCFLDASFRFRNSPTPKVL